jgi:hypothetical protein
MEDVETLMDKIDREVALCVETPTRGKCELILRLISRLKMAIGVFNFTELRYYSRLESQIEANLNRFEEDGEDDPDRWSNHGKTLEEVLEIQTPEET